MRPATLMFDPARLRWSDEILRGDRRSARAAAGRRRIVGGARARHADARADAPGSPRARRSSAAGRTTRAARRASASITPGEAVASWGTSGTVLAPTAQPLVDPGLRAHTFCHVAPGVWYVMGVVLSAGGAFAWYRDQLARELAGSAERGRDARRGSGERSAGRRGRDVPAVSPGRADAASRRVGARRVPRAESRAHARAPDARGARGHLLRASRLAVDPPGAGSVAESSAADRRRREESRSFADCRRMSTACR